ncbi:DUF4179 domain-containing protein [Cytobacillus purgationiresistens]|uniref:DUF4179 domain-containing protein n=1 Tax=Cytobacillus purgationiresistens TaxID=863449 RepID=A0ABU0AJE7_9BACI|nr:DUF4179 domain-containing protein [Cytobacillus purgationiresistens]MDQ0271388.1 hypothetical protein [Cytobacillus purgationiresistens]
MNKEKLNHSMENIEIPVDKLVARERAAMAQGKKRSKITKITKHSALVACGLCITLLGSGFVSTGMAAGLSNLPFIGPIYAEFRDIASDQIQKDQLATPIDIQDSQNGITMTVKEAIYDGGRLVVTVEYTGENDLSLEEGRVGKNEVTINGQPIEEVMGTKAQDPIEPNKIIEYHQFTLANNDQDNDKINVAVHGEDLFGYKGNWQVNFPLEKLDGNIETVLPGVTAETSDKKYAITAEKVIFSPLSTRIDLRVDYPAVMDENDTWPWFDFTVVDDKGKVYDGIKLQAGMAGNFGHEMVLELPPMDSAPHSLTLKPADINKEGYREEISELKLEIPFSH